jgi:hypothetical protein
MARKILKPGHIKLLTPLAEQIVPTRGPQVKRLVAKVVLHIDRSLSELPACLRRLFLLGLRLFDFAPRLFSPSHRPFHVLARQEQRAFIELIGKSSFFGVLRIWLFTARGLILLCYYSQPEAAAAIGYEPRQWARQKIQARRRALRVTESILQKEVDSIVE